MQDNYDKFLKHERVRSYINCDKCENEIYYEDSISDADDCYFIEDEFYCEDCFEKHLDMYRKTSFYELKED